jgi:zinc transport system permease protein
MIDTYYKMIGALFPFSWAQYAFMKNAFLAIIFIAPLFALLGTLVVGKRMAFFSDVLGHSALTGIALGVILGLREPFWAMLIFVVLLAIMINLFKGLTQASSDTVLGVFFALTVALGIVILSKGGGFNKFTGYLIGDILAISRGQIYWLAGITILVFWYWSFFGNNLVLISVNPLLARTRGVRVFWTETGFVVILALIVAISIRLIGILMINSLLILPAAAARVFTNSVREYTFWSVILSLISGIFGLILSYYLGTASGATIVLFCAGLYLLAAIFGKFWRRRLTG